MVEKIKDDDIRKVFRRCMYSSLSTAEWEVTWQNLVQRIEEGGVCESLTAWLEMIYRKRERWAEAFFTGHFFGGMTSTQRCEGMNNHLKFGIGRCWKIYEILPRLARTLKRMRNEVIKDDFNCRNSSPVLITHMRSLEGKLAHKITHDMYLVARHQIKLEKKYLVVNKISFTGSFIFYVTQYKRPERKWTVEVNNSNSDPQFKCSCKLFESDGVPCAHMFCVMKTEHMETLPDSLIHTRWTKTARENCIHKAPLHNGSDKSMQISRCAALHSVANNICYNGSLTGEGFRIVQT
jgi:zinc finger SWIM domain-containing protein 3